MTSPEEERRRAERKLGLEQATIFQTLLILQLEREVNFMQLVIDEIDQLGPQGVLRREMIVSWAWAAIIWVGVFAFWRHHKAVISAGGRPASVARAAPPALAPPARVLFLFP